MHYFYFLKSDFSEERYAELYKYANHLEFIFPRSLSLPHYTIKYKLLEMERKGLSDISESDYEYVARQLEMARKNKHYDADTVRFLAKYENNNPEIYNLLEEKYPGQDYFKMNAEELYQLSISYDPLVLGNYHALHKFYKAEQRFSESYNTINKFLISPNVIRIHPYRLMELKILMLEAANEGGLVYEAKKTSQELLDIQPCYDLALEVLGKSKPSGCKD